LKVRILSPANTELREAVRFYDHHQPGLGLRFFKEVEKSIERIRLMPEAWTQISERTRRCLLKGFPYALLYVVEDDVILITAVAHLHRDPERYDDRIVYIKG
jgi:toxin ParE1/3/4